MLTGDGLFWLAITCMVVGCLAAIGARSLRRFSRHELEQVCQRHDQLDQFGQILRSHESVALGVEILVVLATTLFAIASTGWFWDLAERPNLPGWGWLVLCAACVGITALIGVVWIPWAVSRLFAETFLFHTWRIWQGVSRTMEPFSWGSRLVGFLLQRASGRQPETQNEDTFEEEIRTIVSEGHREGLLEEDASKMIEGVIELGDADVAEIMTPRTDMHMISLNMEWGELIKDVVHAGHTRIPVYDKNRDDIVGILYSKDLLPELAKPDDQSRRSLSELMRRPVFVPETKAVDDLLEMFQQMRTHIAIVLDEYGGVAGLVTIEDALEEIVGEIVDEYDEDLVDELERIDDHTWEALGKAHVDEVNSALDLDLPEDSDFDTIAGFVFTELGRIPKKGESVTWNATAKFTVMEVTRRRIERIRIERFKDEQREIA